MKTKIVGVIVFVGFMFCLVWASTAPHHKPSSVIECSVHMKGKLLTSLVQYANQHDGHFPKTLDALVEEGLMESKDVGCPTGDAHATIRQYEYLPIRSFEECDQPRVIIVEDPNNHNGKFFNVGFCDGHVEMIEKLDAKRFMKEHGINLE